MDKLYRLANIIGLDTKNVQHTAALKEAMYQIKDIDDFFEYCREQKDFIEYATKTERLDTLATRYKKTINNIPTEQLEVICSEIVSKFKTAIQILRDNEEVFDGHLQRLKVDSVQYFMNKEIELMNSVGGLNRLLFLYDLGTLYETLYEKSVKLVLLKNTNAQLSDGQKRVKQIINKK